MCRRYLRGMHKFQVQTWMPSDKGYSTCNAFFRVQTEVLTAAGAHGSREHHWQLGGGRRVYKDFLEEVASPRPSNLCARKLVRDAPRRPAVSPLTTGGLKRGECIQRRGWKTPGKRQRRQPKHTQSFGGREKNPEGFVGKIPLLQVYVA